MFEKSRGSLLVATIVVLLSVLYAATAAAQRPEPEATVQTPDKNVVKRRSQGMTLTWVKTGLFIEADETEHSTVTINEPRVMKFRWGTNAPGAETGYWRLRTRKAPVAKRGVATGPSLQQANSNAQTLQEKPAGMQTAEVEYDVLGSGVATNTPKGQFEINLASYLPATPPSEATIYYLDVIGRTNAKVDGSTTISPGQAGTKVSAKDVGEWAAPVVITYVGDTSAPTLFDIDGVYRKVSLVIDKIVLVTDQEGGGEEEYYYGGFVQEFQRRCVGASQQDCRFSAPLRLRSFGNYKYNQDNYIVLNPPSEANIGISRGFKLGSGTNKVSAPRQFMFNISLIEEDGGSSVIDWHTGLVEFQNVADVGDIFQMTPDEVEDFFSEHAGDAIHYVADGVRAAIGAVGAGTAWAVPVAAGVVVAATVVVAIIEDMADDYYGTQVVTLTIPSNRVADVHQLNGEFFSDGGENARYVLTEDTWLQFRGPPGVLTASSFDGVVNIEFHWEFSELEQE